MNIEKSIIEFKKMIERDKDTLRYWKSDTFGHYDEPIKKLEKDVLISETLLTAYEKEKEKNKKLDEFCRKELAFERRLKRENREPDEFNQGRFYVSENIRKIIEEE